MGEQHHCIEMLALRRARASLSIHFVAHWHDGASSLMHARSVLCSAVVLFGHMKPRYCTKCARGPRTAKARMGFVAASCGELVWTGLSLQWIAAGMRLPFLRRLRRCKAAAACTRSYLNLKPCSLSRGRSSFLFLHMEHAGGSLQQV